MITFAEKSKIMANKTFNIYCDESCHLEHDHKPYMLLGNISCARYAEPLLNWESLS